MRLFLALPANSKIPERLYISNIKESPVSTPLYIFVLENSGIRGFLCLNPDAFLSVVTLVCVGNL